MNLPFLKKKEKIEYFLALLLREEKVSAVIFEEILGKIKMEYLIKLKKVSDALGLSPIGFLVIHEAIARLIQEEEGVPVSAILTEVDKKGVAVSLIRAGKVSSTKRAKIEGSIPETTDKILHYFVNHEILPSRIIIFDDKDLEKLSQEFIGHAWSKSLPFLHVPQITTLVKGFDAKAILFGAAVQMGFEMLNEEDLKPQKDISDYTSNKKEENKALEPTVEETKSPEMSF